MIIPNKPIQLTRHGIYLRDTIKPHPMEAIIQLTKIDSNFLPFLLIKLVTFKSSKALIGGNYRLYSSCQLGFQTNSSTPRKFPREKYLGLKILLKSVSGLLIILHL